ncbi:MAG: ribonuclease H family protein [Bacteroidetes bacterium]|nr:ribonuclease H family protein [Bacteroidota bacterium]
MSKNKNNFYVVWNGRKRGIFNSWEECKEQVHGFVDARFMGFKTKETAEAAFKDDPSKYIGKEVVENTLSDEQISLIGQPVMDSISVDAAYDTSTGIMEYRGVYTKTKKEIFWNGPFENATNNIGEFLAIVHALGYLKHQKRNIPVYSDSLTAISWIESKNARSKIFKTSRGGLFNEENEEVAKLYGIVTRAEKWLKENDCNNPVLKWETAAWGENPADFGRK